MPATTSDQVTGVVDAPWVIAEGPRVGLEVRDGIKYGRKGVASLFVAMKDAGDSTSGFEDRRLTV